MFKNVAALEISSSKVKFAVGNLVSGKPSILFYGQKPIPEGIVSKGEILNEDALSKIVASFGHFEDESLRLKVDTDDISLVIPAIGFQVYMNEKCTNVVSSENIIENLDIDNVISLIQKEKIPNGNTIVDIVPDSFVTDAGKAYKNPPLGAHSSSILLKAKVHTAPEGLLASYKRTVQDASLRIRRSALAPYCACQLVASEDGMPHDYFLLDIGESLSTLSFVGGDSLYGSVIFMLGGKDLTKDLSNAFSISFQEAEGLKRKYGYDPRERVYRSALRLGEKAFDAKDVSKERWNEAIRSFFSKYCYNLKNAVESLAKKQISDSADLRFPFIVTGGGSSLNGLLPLLREFYGDYDFIPFAPKAMGARDPSATNLVGLILAGGEYRGTLEDHYRGISALSREKGE